MLKVLFRRSLFLCLCTLLLQHFAIAADVVIVDSYHAEFPWTADCRIGFTDNLNTDIEFTFYELDSKRLNASEFEPLAGHIFQQVLANPPDLVVTMDDNALRLLGQKLSDKGLPIVFMGVNNDPRDYFRYNSLPANVTGVLERPLLDTNTNVIYQLIPPKSKKILLMMDDGVTSQALIQHAFAGLNKIDMARGVTVEVWTTDTFANWQKKVLQLDSFTYDALIIGSYANLTDEFNKQVPDVTISEWTSRHSKIPMFTFWGHIVGKDKSVGGAVISGYDQGAQAAQAVNDILIHGKKPFVNIPKYSQYIFSKKELARWGIELPEQLKARALLTE